MVHPRFLPWRVSSTIAWEIEVLGRNCGGNLVNDVHTAPDPSVASGLVMKHSDLITAWAKRTQNENPGAGLESESLNITVAYLL